MITDDYRKSPECIICMRSMITERARREERGKGERKRH
jgi:hypothetical protein